jgi:hypothetical protein
MQRRLSNKPGHGIERHARLTPGINGFAYVFAGGSQVSAV